MPDRASVDDDLGISLPSGPIKVPGDAVVRALGAGWSEACDGLVALSWYRFEHRKGRGSYRTLQVRAGERHVEVSLSPSGSSVRVFVDGIEA